MKTLARWCVRRRWAVVGGWVVALLVLAVAVVGLGTAFTDATELPNSESSTAYSLLASQAGADVTAGTDVTGGTVAGNIVWHTTDTSVLAPSVRQSVSTMLAEVAKLPGVQSVSGPYAAVGSVVTSPSSAEMVNTSTNTAFATVTMVKDAGTDTVVETAERLRGPTLDVQIGGEAFTAVPGGSHITEGLGILVALLILLLVFRSIWAALLPIITGVVGVGVSLLAVMLASHVIDLAATSLTMGALIGLGVGIDYALFVVNRFRKAVVSGASVGEATVQALNTSGRAVIFAGLTVIIALLGMFVVDLGILTGMAQAAAVTVLVTVIAALTLLPALLGILGHRVLSRRQRTELALGYDEVSTSPARPTLAARWAALLHRAPARMATGGLLLIVVLAAPVLSMRVGASDASSDPADSSSHAYFELMAGGFGQGFDASLLVVGDTPDASAARAFTTLAATMSTVPGVASVTVAPSTAGGPVMVATVVPTTSAQDAQTADLVTSLRSGVISAAEAGTDLEVYVGGTTATSIDISAALMNKLPLYLGLIALLGFLLLAVAFRSIVVPLVGAVSNLATIFVGLGAITAVFQFGWGTGLLGVGTGAPVMYLVPVLIVGITFGLSMDYQVFLSSRVHEEWTTTKDNARAVRVGVTETAQVIAAAATIMLAVFASFGFSGERIVSEIGIGLAIAVVIDAFVMRLTVIPALMNLIGQRNWAYPRWAERITPHLSIEGAEHREIDALESELVGSASTAREPVDTRPGR